MRIVVDDHVTRQAHQLINTFTNCKNSEEDLGICMQKEYGFHTQVKQSSIGPFAGDGVFARTSPSGKNDIDAFKVVGIYAGNLISPFQQWVAKVKAIDLNNGWVLSRPKDRFLLDGFPYGSGCKNYDILKAKLDHSIHIGQLVNHPPKGIKPNTGFYHLIIPKENFSSKELDSIFMFNSSNYIKDEDKNIRLSVIVSTDKIKEGEELFVDYGFALIYHWDASEFKQPELMLPEWYHPPSRN